jgi:hypothetical protein
MWHLCYKNKVIGNNIEMKTVYVIGAGASKEAGLPTGEELKSKISKLLDIKFGRFNSLESGDNKIVEALKLHAGDTKKIEPFMDAVWRITDALPLAISIDNFIDTHRGNDKIALCGKLAIVRSILEAESKSKLNFDRLKANANIDFNSISDTWYISFFKLLTENCAKNELCERFKNITLIIFNYDRCVEHFLYYALQRYYGVNKFEAAELVKAINIFHPYGSVGTLPWLYKDGNIEFGSEVKPEKLLKLAQEIKTFTEGTDPNSSEINEIKLHMAQTKRLVFLGFAFHKLNMKLIKPKQELQKGRRVNVECSRNRASCFATAFEVSDSNQKVILSLISTLYPSFSPIVPQISNSKCNQFFIDFSKSLSF